MEAVAPALAAVLLCTICTVVMVVRSRGGRRSLSRAHVVEQALTRAREKQHTITDEGPGDQAPKGPHAA